MQKIDVTTFNNEHELFEIRYNILVPFVDEFIVVEFNKTFSGKSKEPSFKYKDWKKVSYHFHTEELYEKYRELAESSPNTKGASHWVTEFMQKESIKDALIHLQDNDIVFIGDVDEIPEPIHFTGHEGGVIKLKLRVYTYYLNNRSNEVFWGTIKGFYKDIKDECLNHLRNNHERRNTTNECGWHFTSLKDGLRRKLTDSYTKESYATDEVMSNLEKNIENNKDFLGRGFTFTKDESQLPKYILDNKEKYAKFFLK